MIRRLLLGGLAALMLAGQAMAANVTPVDVDNATPLFSVDSQLFSGSTSAAGTIVTLNTTGYGYIEFQFTSAGAGNTFVVESSNDGVPGTGSTFATSTEWATSTSGIAATSGTPQAVTQVIAPVTGATMRIRVSVYSSGTVSLVGALKRVAAPVPPTQTVSAAGTVASAAADSGNPIKIGCKYNATLPTFVDGNRADCQVSAKGELITALGTSFGQTGISSSPGAFHDPSGSGRPLAVDQYFYNGTTTDGARSANFQDGTATGVASVEDNGRSFSEITTATTTAVKSGATTVHTVNVNTCVSGATVKLYNALTASGTPITITCPASTGALPTFTYDAYFGTGLTVVTSGATDVTVTYR